MKGFFKIAGLIIVAILVIVALLLWLKPKVLVPLVFPEIERLHQVKVNAVGDTAYINSSLAVRSRSFFKIKIDSIRFKLLLFGKPYLDDKQYLGLDLLPGERDTILLPLKIPYVHLMKDFKTRRQKEDSAVYELKLSLLYSTFFGKVEAPVDKSGRFKIPTPPEFKLAGIHLRKLGLNKIQADVEMKIVNKGDFDFNLKRIHYHMVIVDEGEVDGNYDDIVKVKSHNETSFEMPVTIHLKRVGKTLLDIIRNQDEYRYELKIKTTLHSPNTDVDPIELAISKKGITELKK